MIQLDLSWQKLDKLWRLALPQIILALFVVLQLIALPVPVLGAVKPFFILMILYYWSIYRPTLVPPVLCFLVGIALDSLSGMPLGLNSLIFVALRWLISNQRRFLMGQSYITIWAAFGVVGLTVGLLRWLLTGLLHMQWGAFYPVLTVVLVSLLIFPFISLLLVGIHRLLPVASKAIP